MQAEKNKSWQKILRLRKILLSNEEKDNVTNSTNIVAINGDNISSQKFIEGNIKNNELNLFDIPTSNDATNHKSFKAKKKKKVHHTEETTKTPAVIFVGRIPHGFYEEQMRKYFSQFGKVISVRLSRSPKTGRSRGFAFIKFDCEEVARIAVDSMDNYLMFGKLLKCSLLDNTSARDMHALFKRQRLWSSPDRRRQVMIRNYNENRQCISHQHHRKLLRTTLIRDRNRNRRLKRLNINYICPRTVSLVETVPPSYVKHKKFITPDSDRSDSEFEN